MVDNENAPKPGSGDCYNRVTDTCNGKHPGADWGDSAYRQCIEGGLDWCDANEPVMQYELPNFTNQGDVMQVARRFHQRTVTQLTVEILGLERR